MSTYHNVMETIVVKKLNELWKDMEGCKCDKCRNDIIAYALNQLTPHYVVTDEGELYIRASKLSSEQEFDIVITLIKSIKTIAENPKHKN